MISLCRFSICTNRPKSSFDRSKTPSKPFHFPRFPTLTSEKIPVPSANPNIKTPFFSPAKLFFLLLLLLSNSCLSCLFRTSSAKNVFCRGSIGMPRVRCVDTSYPSDRATIGMVLLRVSSFGTDILREHWKDKDISVCSFFLLLHGIIAKDKLNTNFSILTAIALKNCSGVGVFTIPSRPAR